MKRATHAGTLVVALMLSGVALAHGPAARPQALLGGVAVAAAPYHLELMVKGGWLRLYVRDQENRPADTRDVTARALVWGKSRSVELELMHEDTGAFTGRFAPDLEPQRIVLTLAVPGRAPVTAWFSRLQGESP